MRYTLLYRTGLFLYLGFMVGYAVSQVGVTYPANKADWTLPLTLFGLLSFPAVMGYCMGKSE